MIYEVVLGDYRFRFKDFVEAATLATSIAESGEKALYMDDDSEKGYHYEWSMIDSISIRFIKEESPTDANQ